MLKEATATVFVRPISPSPTGPRLWRPGCTPSTCSRGPTPRILKNKNFIAHMKKILLLLTFIPIASAQTASDPNYLQQIAQFRTQRAKNLTAPEGWFSLVALHWLQPGDTT